MEKIYKVTSATVNTTKNGYKVFKLQLNNSIWASKLFPLRKYDLEHDKLYKLYTEKNNLDFLKDKFISISIYPSQYGYEFSYILSYDALEDFKKQLYTANGSAFSTKLPIYDFLSSMQRNIEQDGSIKIISDLGDIRVSKIDDVDICYQFDISNEKLNLKNIELIFNRFYKDILPRRTASGDLSDSYYTISMHDVAIVRMDHDVKVSNKMTLSGDYNRWITNVILRIGDKLPEEHIQFLNNQ